MKCSPEIRPDHSHPHRSPQSFLVLLGTISALLLFLFGCALDYALSPKDRVALLVEEAGLSLFAQPGSPSPPPGTIYDLFELVMQHDINLKKIHFDIRKSDVGIARSKSVLLPKIDILVGANTSYDGTDGWANTPELGLLMRYDLNAALFHNEATLAAVARKNELIHQYRLAAKKSRRDLCLHLSQLIYEQQILHELERIQQINTRLLQLHKKLDAIVPDATGLEINLLTSTSISDQHRLFSIQNSLERETALLSLLAATPLDFSADLESYHLYLNQLVDHAELMIETEPLSRILQESLKVNPHLKIFENQLALARLNQLKVQRDRLPRINASVGGGSLLNPETDGTSDFILKFELLYSLFDSGESKRKQQLGTITLQQTETEIRETVRRHALSLKTTSRQLVTTGKQVHLLFTEQDRLKIQFDLIHKKRRGKGASDTIMTLSLEQSLRRMKITLLKNRLAHMKAAIEFTFQSGLLFQPSDNHGETAEGNNITIHPIQHDPPKTQVQPAVKS